MHKNGMDCCIHVLAQYPSGNLFVNWVNLGYVGKPYIVEYGSVLSLQKWYDWVDVTEKINSKRVKPGLP